MKKFLALTILLLTFWPGSVRAEIKEVYATYTYTVGYSESRIEARENCLAQAKRQALEQAGTYLESYTETVDYQLTRDRIISFSTGILQTQIVKEETELIRDIPVITMKIRARIDTGLLQNLIDKFRFSNRPEQGRILFE